MCKALWAEFKQQLLQLNIHENESGMLCFSCTDQIKPLMHVH